MPPTNGGSAEPPEGGPRCGRWRSRLPPTGAVSSGEQGKQGRAEGAGGAEGAGEAEGAEVEEDLLNVNCSLFNEKLKLRKAKLTFVANFPHLCYLTVCLFKVELPGNLR